MNEDHLLSDEEFQLVWVGTLKGLVRTLGRPYTSKIHDLDDPVARIIKTVWGNYDKKRRALRDWDAYRLGLLGFQLDTLKALRPEMFKSLRKKYRRLTQNEYIGWRLEVQVASRLASQGFTFEKTEAPDFTITTESGEAYIECVSAKLTAVPDRKVLYKLETAIESKGAKPYCNQSTLLFLDYTNILFMSAAAGAPLSTADISPAVRKAFEETQFGALFVVALVADLDRRTWTLGVADKVLADSATEPLRVLIDRYAPPEEPRDIRFGVPYST